MKIFTLSCCRISVTANIIIITILFFPLITNSQNPEWMVFTSMAWIQAIAGDENYIWVGSDCGGLTKIDKLTGERTTYQKSNSGIPDNNVSTLLIDKERNIWIGMISQRLSSGGLAKFNGENWTIYNTNNSSIPSNSIIDLVVDSSGVLWVATEPYNIRGGDGLIYLTGGGLAKFDGENWEVYNTTNSGLPDDKIQALAIDKEGKKWIGIRGSLVKFDGTDWTIYGAEKPELPLSQINAIVCDTLGNVWLGTGRSRGSDGGVLKFDGENWTIYNSQNFEIPGLSCTEFSALGLDIDRHSNIWIGICNMEHSVYGSSNGNVVKFDGDNWTIYGPENSELPEGGVYTFDVGLNDEILIGTRYQGVATFDGDNWKLYEQDLPYNIVQTIAFDRQGDKWIGTWCGLAKFDGSNWTKYNPLNSGMSSMSINDIEMDLDGNMWIGTGPGGLFKFNGTDWTVYNTNNSELPDNNIYSIAGENDKNIWIATNFGLVKYDGENWTVYNTKNSDLPRDKVRCIAVDLDGTKWIVVSNCGLIKYDGKNWTVYNAENSGLPQDAVLYLDIDNQGNKWIGTASGGLVKFDGIDWTVYDKLTSEIPSIYISALSTDSEGNVWIGFHDNSIVKFDGANWMLYDMDNFLQNDFHVNCISCDTQKNIWVGTDKGLAVYREGGVILTGIDERGHIGVPSEFTLSQNYPNPFNPSTAISFSVSKKSCVKIYVYNILGELVRVLADREYSAGSYHILWDGTDSDNVHASGGLYFYRLTTNAEVITKKMILLR